MKTSGIFSSASNEWGTPQWLYDQLNAEFHFKVDVCATPENAKHERYFTEEDDGLKQQWHKVGGGMLDESSLRQTSLCMGKESIRRVIAGCNCSMSGGCQNRYKMVERLLFEGRDSIYTRTLEISRFEKLCSLPFGNSDI